MRCGWRTAWCRCGWKRLGERPRRAIAKENSMKVRWLVVCLLAAVAANAQSSNGVTVSGSIRSRVYGWDWFQPDSGDNSYAYSGNILRIGLSQAHESWDWTAEFEAPMLFGLPAGAVAPGVQ